MRKDQPQEVDKFQGAFYGGKALLVLGGPSGKEWQSLQDEIKPDVILGANGTCFEIDNLDFHLVVENMHMAAGRASKGEERYQTMMKIISPENTAKVKMISFLNWKGSPIVDGRVKAIKIKRMGELGDNYEEQFERFSFREYGDGFLAGPLFDHPGALTSPKIQFRVGTVATQLLHLAGILGVKQVHTIGIDFCFRESSQHHHWYRYTNYQPDRFRTGAMFTQYEGLNTQWDWVSGGLWLRDMVEPLMERDGLQWVDHSNGLLKSLGLRCANGR